MKKLILLVSLLMGGVAMAQDTNKATLYRVEEGVFELREGKAIDITDRHLLLAFRKGRKCLEIVMGGQDDCIEVGKRYDLKWRHAPFHLGNMFQDRENCFLDVVNVQNLKGASALATFRLYCV